MLLPLLLAPALADDTSAPPDAGGPPIADARAEAPPADDKPDAPRPLIRPGAWVRPGFAWIADDPTNPTAQDGFVVDARISVDASLPNFPVSARVELEVLSEIEVADAALTVSPADWIDVRLGQVKPPFSIHRLASDTRRQLVRAPTTIAAARIPREIGADATVRVPIAGKDRIVVASGVYNGEGPNRIQNVNQRFKLVQRVLVTPLGTRRGVFEGTSRQAYVGIGGGWIYDYAGDGLAAEESNTLGVELQAAWDVLSLQAEALDEEIVHANASVADYHVQGFYVQLGSFVPAPWVRDHVELVGRFELAEPNTAFGAADGESLPEFQATRRVTGGLNYYVRKDTARFHDLKVQLAYENVVALEGVDTADDTFTVHALARF